MLYGHVLIEEIVYDLDDVSLNVDKVAKLTCRHQGVMRKFITSAPVERIGGYHGQPTLELVNGRKVELWFDNPDVSDVFVWGLQAKLNGIDLYLNAIKLIR